MKLEDKIRPHALLWDCYNDEPEKYNHTNKLIKIAEDFAIGFAEWCDNNYFRMGYTSFWAKSMDWDNDNKFTTKELLEIYKKEKGL
jgi:hypothetical protein